LVDQNTSVSIRDLNIYYGDYHAIKHATMDIAAKDITALIGPSGSGKSTVLRAIDRMNELIPGTRTTGEVVVDGENVYDPDVDVVDLRRRVGMVFQRPNPFPMTIYDNVAYGPRIHGTASGKDLDGLVERSLKQAALWDEVKDKLKQSAFALSGGQQQRLCIARVLAVGPEIVLMDEPASALDPISTLKIEDLMRDLAKDYTIIIVTHNMQQAARVSTFTGFFLSGELIEFGRSDTLFTKPRDKRTEDYITGRFG
jgi:phosphate transport system ATP-binding protein